MNKELAIENFQTAIQHLASDRLLKLRSWKIMCLEYPVIDILFCSATRRSMRIMFSCPNWDMEPPSVALLSEDGQFMIQVPSGSGVFHPGPHPLTGRPFICTPGTIEYHTHPSHINDSWENYKRLSSHDLGGLATQIWNAWQKTSDI